MFKFITNTALKYSTQDDQSQKYPFHLKEYRQQFGILIVKLCQSGKFHL